MIKKIELPKKIVIGTGILSKSEEFVNDSNPVVLTGPTTAKLAGNKVAEVLGCQQIVKEKQSMKQLKQGLLESRSDRIFAVGGGSIIDAGKILAKELGMSLVSIPTNCAHDGIASPTASVKTKKGVTSVVTNPPAGVLVDLGVIRKSPKRFILAGVGDVVGKYSAVKDWQLGAIIKGEYMGDYAGQLSLMTAKVVMNSVMEIKNKTEKGLATLIEALISSGAAMGIAGSSRPASGSEHKFSHALDWLGSPALHGEQVGVGTIVMSYLQGENWTRVKNALKTAGCPTTARELGVSKGKMVKAMMLAKKIRPERYTIIEHINLNRKIAVKALRDTGVI